LERKLKPHEDVPGELTQVLDEMQARDFINDGRAIDSVINHRARKVGGARLKQELAAKGLGGEAVALALAALKDSELDRAHAVWLHKFGQRPQDPREHAKQTRFLLSRGFAAEVVSQVLR
jgi:regulatory protein